MSEHKPRRRGLTSSWRGLYEAQKRWADYIQGRLVAAEENNRELTLALKESLAEDVRLAYKDRIAERKLIDRLERRRIFLKLIPATINAIFGHEVFPVSFEDTALMEAACEDMDEGEARQFAEMLGRRNPALSGLIMNRYRTIRAERARAARDLRDLSAQAIGYDSVVGEPINAEFADDGGDEPVPMRPRRQADRPSNVRVLHGEQPTAKDARREMSPTDLSAAPRARPAPLTTTRRPP